jgi:hypothetical protein
MRKRPTDREQLLFQLNRLSDHEIQDVLNFITRLHASGREPSPADGSEDDLISGLSAAYENRRARQVFEWESARRRAEAHALAPRTVRR